MKRILRNGWAYGVVFFVLSFLLGYYSFGLPLNKSLLVSTPIGIGALLLNGLFYSRFAKSSKKLNSISIQLHHAETLKLGSPANHTINEYAVAGKLFLTDKRLIFKSYKQDEYAWVLRTLHSMEFYPSIFIAGGDFIIRDEMGNRLVFEVDDFKIWKKALSAH
jgi:hypothetical protein